MAKRTTATGNPATAAAAPIPERAPSPTPRVDALVRLEPDLVDRIFDYLVELLPEIADHQCDVKRKIRNEFGGDRGVVRRRGFGDRNPLIDEVARMFNGRNATEVARQLRIGRATVYRLLKVAGRPDA